MPDPMMMRSAAVAPPPPMNLDPTASPSLFDPPRPMPRQVYGGTPPRVLTDTSRLAGEKAALSSRGRRAQILQLLEEHGPQTLFELAGRMGVHDHQISGRMTNLREDGLIEFAGCRRAKPETGCSCEVYKLSDAPAIAAAPGVMS